MASHNDTGAEAEAMAANWLTDNGFDILHRNWRFSHYEIDIVAYKDDTLHFVEVKARKAFAFGFPEESVSRKKFKHLQRAADQFLYLNPGHKWIQYDILAIRLFADGENEFFLLEDVFL